jgi:hypothetical protein
LTVPALLPPRTIDLGDDDSRFPGRSPCRVPPKIGCGINYGLISGWLARSVVIVDAFTNTPPAEAVGFHPQRNFKDLNLSYTKANLTPLLKFGKNVRTGLSGPLMDHIDLGVD